MLVFESSEICRAAAHGERLHIQCRSNHDFSNITEMTLGLFMTVVDLFSNLVILLSSFGMHPWCISILAQTTCPTCTQLVAVGLEANMQHVRWVGHVLYTLLRTNLMLI